MLLNQTLGRPIIFIRRYFIDIQILPNKILNSECERSSALTSGCSIWVPSTGKWLAWANARLWYHSAGTWLSKSSELKSNGEGGRSTAKLGEVKDVFRCRVPVVVGTRIC